MNKDREQSERRIAPRYRIRVPVQYEQASVTGRGTTWDISASGVHVSMRRASSALSIPALQRSRSDRAAGVVAVRWLSNSSGS